MRTNGNSGSEREGVGMRGTGAGSAQRRCRGWRRPRGCERRMHGHARVGGCRRHAAGAARTASRLTPSCCMRQRARNDDCRRGGIGGSRCKVAGMAMRPAQQRKACGAAVQRKLLVVGQWGGSGAHPMPAYSALPPPCFSRAASPPPDRIICSRVLMVSSGYSAASTTQPAMAPEARLPQTTLHAGGGLGGAGSGGSCFLLFLARSITGFGPLDAALDPSSVKARILLKVWVSRCAKEATCPALCRWQQRSVRISLPTFHGKGLAHRSR